MSVVVERTREKYRSFEGRIKNRAVFPINRIEEAIFRLENSDKQVMVLGEQLRKGEGVFSEAVFENQGRVLVDLNKLKELIDNEKDAGRRRIGRKLCRSLDNDLAFRTGNSPELVDFKKNRKEIAQIVGGEVRQYCVEAVDFECELCDGKHLIENQELKDAYLVVQRELQAMAEKLFAASKLRRFKPKVHLTKDRSVNAFVFTNDKGELAKEIMSDTQDGQEKIELPIFIHSGLVKAFNTKDELAAILAHEFSHTDCRKSDCFGKHF